MSFLLGFARYCACTFAIAMSMTVHAERGYLLAGACAASALWIAKRGDT